ncbi:two-component sensor histidine kinase [Pseudoxanthomonas broegbernensis]|uniref:histidine kinase n=1 Tax=Pseudoxanthomonas broegbernensis TaxID=83619 RepID=A0A7V8GND8_9GAMM|nr:HAMP domain-containing sensor histidine kinase [Pseudoxanthomonas broegbernensis]KAF1686939.1 two-component sensor histidine kinase [Pseudoxanthomonas broegbernensis]MBB6065459.1 signal transduction histidine kinase [Pseudoxanthomonas broegbernensis]
MAARTSLRRRILLGLLGYTVALTLAVFAHGVLVNEHAEALVWQTLLDSELDHVVERITSDPEYRWVDTSSMVLFDGRRAPLPDALQGLAPGVHDEIVIDGVVRVALIRQLDGGPVALALDITDLEQREFDMWITVMGSTLTMVVLISLAVFWGVNRLVRPLTMLSGRIEALKPDQPGQRIGVPASATTELVVIADSINDYLRRNDSFVERERVFIDTASHELRTPLSVIAGASELALGQPSIPPAIRGQLTRIRQTSRDVERLVTLLLVLAKDPSRLAGTADRFSLDQTVAEIVEQHAHLAKGKDLTIEVAGSAGVEIVAPLPVVQTAIGNLLRNAIENSDRGTIALRIEPPATVVISDPGHGMTPEEISAIYARIARGGGERMGGGIGLDLIARLCEHLGWTLDIRSDTDRGTVARLTLSSTPLAADPGND